MMIHSARLLTLASRLHLKTDAAASDTPASAPPESSDLPPGGPEPDPEPDAREHRSHRVRHHATHAMTGLHLLLEGAEIAGVLTGALVGGALGTAAVAMGLGALGVSHIRHGLRHEDADDIAEGTGSLILAARSAVNSVAITGGLAHEGLAAEVAHVAHGFLPGLGVAHGVLDVGLGARRIYQGIQGKDRLKTTMGALGVGLGVSLCAAATGVGLPALAAAGVFLIGKVVAHEMEERRHHASEGHHPPDPGQPPATPPPQPKPPE